MRSSRNPTATASTAPRDAREQADRLRKRAETYVERYLGDLRELAADAGYLLAEWPEPAGWAEITTGTGTTRPRTPDEELRMVLWWIADLADEDTGDHPVANVARWLRRALAATPESLAAERAREQAARR